MSSDQFFSIYSHGFVRVAACVPACRIADPQFNADATLDLAQRAAAQGAAVILFPELGLSSYTCDDLFRQQALLAATEHALQRVVEASAHLPSVLVVGLPLRVRNALFNCAAVIAGGRIRGIVPKTYLPNYSEFYEARQFTAGSDSEVIEIDVVGQRVSFGAVQLFDITNLPGCRLHVEICEDLWVPVPPSAFGALAGATVLLNLSASNIVIGKASYRRQLVLQQSASCLAAYVYTSAGQGESSTDMAWDGQAIICENGELLQESTRFSMEPHWTLADIDIDRLAHERMKTTSFNDNMKRHAAEIDKFRLVEFKIPHLPQGNVPLQRNVERFPYVPADPQQRDARCQEVYQIQVQALVQRLKATGIQNLVIGVSGGLDSTQALLVCARAMDLLQLPRTNILGYSLPGFATSTRTRQQALQLMDSIGCYAEEIDIEPSCRQMLQDIGHPYSEGAAQYDVTFENVQAGERTSHLFRLANRHRALVIGTGDLSELALGWCTYGVGDQMAHYNVNASVPKTLIKHLIRWVAESGEIGEAGSRTLRAILDTKISPELIPGADAAAPSQSTESAIGPYDLQDFHLYYTLRYGFSPPKVAFLAFNAWADAQRGAWPDSEHAYPHSYTLAQITQYLTLFLERFFRRSQFKRSCAPNSAKVGSGGSLSPRGDWRAPSDADADVWLTSLAQIPSE